MEASKSMILGVIGGAAIAASFLNFSLWPVAWLAFVPILVATFGSGGPRQALRVGMAAGLATNLPAFYWLVGTIHSFGGFPLPVAALFYFILSLFTSLQFVIFVFALRRSGPGPLALAAPLVWVALELLFPNLFPWRLANSQLNLLPLLQIGEWTGPFGVSFVMVWLSAALAAAVVHGWKSVRGALPTVVAAIAAMWVFGSMRLPVIEARMDAGETVRVGIVQGNLTIEEKGNVRYFRTNVRTYGSLTRELVDRSDVVIWPETVITEPLSRSMEAFPSATLDMLGTQGPLLTGALTWEGDPADPLFFNSVLLIGKGGEILGRSDKQILMPFGEFLPFASWFPSVRALSPQTGNFQAGSRVEILEVPGVGRFAPLNCYEDLMAPIARTAVADGAEILFAVANDAWFGRTAGPRQHGALALWRAIENRRFLIRVTNTGVTEVISPTGRVVRRLPVFEAGSAVEEVQRLGQRTFYSRFGDVFAWAVVLAALGMILQARRTG